MQHQACRRNGEFTNKKHFPFFLLCMQVYKHMHKNIKRSPIKCANSIHHYFLFSTKTFTDIQFLSEICIGNCNIVSLIQWAHDSPNLRNFHSLFFSSHEMHILIFRFVGFSTTYTKYAKLQKALSQFYHQFLFNSFIVHSFGISDIQCSALS